MFDFKEYKKLGLGKSPIERGFFVHECERKLHSIFIFDRFLAQTMQKNDQPLAEAPNIRHWIEFLDIYTQDFERNSDEFYRKLLELRSSHLKVDYTLAAALFNIERSRVCLLRRVTELRGEGFLPAALPLLETPSESKTQTSPRETRAARRASNQISPSDLKSSDSDSEELSAHVLALIERVSLLSDISNAGCIVMAAVEEWILSTAFEMRSLKESYANKNSRAFELDLTAALKKHLVLLGKDFPAVLLADSSNMLVESPCPRPQKLLLQSDLSDIFARYHFSSVGRLDINL